MRISHKGIDYTVDTVDNLVAAGATVGEVCVVTEEGRGGTFKYLGTGVNDDGTIFNGWHRQYEGAVNVKWFGAKADYLLSDGSVNPTPTDDSVAIQKVLDLKLDIDFQSLHYYSTSDLLYYSKAEYTNLNLYSTASIPLCSENYANNTNPSGRSNLKNVYVKCLGTGQKGIIHRDYYSELENIEVENQGASRHHEPNSIQQYWDGLK